MSRPSGRAGLRAVSMHVRIPTELAQNLDKACGLTNDENLSNFVRLAIEERVNRILYGADPIERVSHPTVARAPLPLPLPPMMLPPPRPSAPEESLADADSLVDEVAQLREAFMRTSGFTALPDFEGE